MCQVLSALREVKILSAQNFRKGTQLKLNFTVEGGKTIVFKPAWYTRNQVIEGEVYAGKDRHNSEILAFYLGAVLNFRSTGLVVGRSINIRDVLKLADKELRETIISKGKHLIIEIKINCNMRLTRNKQVMERSFAYMENVFIVSHPSQFVEIKRIILKEPSYMRLVDHFKSINLHGKELIRTELKLYGKLIVTIIIIVIMLSKSCHLFDYLISLMPQSSIFSYKTVTVIIMRRGKIE